jgi:hypothetical protein
MSPCSGLCACSTASRVRAAHPLTRLWSAFTWRDPMLSSASSMRHASRRNRHWPCIVSVRSTTPGAAPMSWPRCSSRMTRPRRRRRSSKSSPEPNCSAVQLGALGIQTNLGRLAPHLSARGRSGSRSGMGSGGCSTAMSAGRTRQGCAVVRWHRRWPTPGGGCAPSARHHHAPAGRNRSRWDWTRRVRPHCSQ